MRCRPACVPLSGSGAPAGGHAGSGHLIRRARAIGALTAALVTVGCTPGPAFVHPSAPPVKGYLPASQKQTTAPGKAGPAMQRFRKGVTPPHRWWHLFHCDRISNLVALAVKHSPTIAAAHATLAQAQASMRANESVFYPQVTANATTSRQLVPGSAFGGSFPNRTYTLHTASLQVGYYPDLFGLNRLVYEASGAQVEVQRDRMEATYLSLESQVVTTALTQASLREQIQATHAVIASEKKMLHLARVRYKAGETTQLDVFSQQSQLSSSEASLPPLEQALDAATNQLAVLAGQFPANWTHAPLKLSEVKLPLHLPVSLPSALVRQRPDIRAAVATLRERNAQVGESIAKRYPRLQLTAQLGSEAVSAGSMFTAGSEMWKLLADFTAPVFEGGKFKAQQQQAKAAYRAAQADYATSVLGAFQQVANALRAIQHDGRTLRARLRAYQAAKQALGLLNTQYRAGAVDYLHLLNGQVTYSQARIAYVKARAQRYIDTAALFDALGGGWWPAQSRDSDKSPPPAHSEPASTRQQESPRIGHS
ncbi:MAG: efflux transporter outer membrane subunit [Gammaproteobacteria bacterium]